MNEITPYIFTSERLGFRNWLDTDIALLQQINEDAKVMEFFPKFPTLIQTKDFIERMKHQYFQKGYCYFAVDKLNSSEFIGFIGLSEQNFNAAFTPCIDIGWRIKSSEWNFGYATEGAKRCLHYALNDLELQNVYAIAPKINTKSIHIMSKIGLVYHSEFEHSLLANDQRLKDCVLYKTP